MSSLRWIHLLVILSACSKDAMTAAPDPTVGGASGAMAQTAPAAPAAPSSAGPAAVATSSAGAPSPTPRGGAGDAGAIDAASPQGQAPAAMPAPDASAPTMMGGLDAATPSAEAGASDGDAATAPAPDSASYAKELDGVFIDAKCDAATQAPLERMATCQHPAGTQRIEKQVMFGGDASKIYEVRLRVRGIWEPTTIQGGERPDPDLPFTIGGDVPAGTNSSDAINYQQYSIRVSKPEQRYWLNDHQYVAHDIHKDDYEASIQVEGGSQVVVSMNDGNEREIANWTEDYFEGLAPYASMPSLGQTLHLAVVSVTERP